LHWALASIARGDTSIQKVKESGMTVPKDNESGEIGK
jgi:hypothetical protein